MAAGGLGIACWLACSVGRVRVEAPRPLHISACAADDQGEVARKWAEVEALLGMPEARTDGPWQLRLQYMAPTQSYRFADSVRRQSADGYLAVVAPSLAVDGDVSRVVVTGMEHVKAKADTLLLSVHAGEGLVDQVAEVAEVVRNSPVAVLAYDLVLHPIQLARLACAGADAVLLHADSQDLEELLNVCTVLGIEAVVEAQDAGQVDLALECGATALVVPAPALAAAIPGHVLSLARGSFTAVAPDAIESLLDAGFDGVLETSSLSMTDTVANIRARRRLQGAVHWGGRRVG